MRKIAAVGSLALLGMASAHAALPAGVTTALDDAKGDGIIAAGLVLVVLIAIGAFKYIRKAL